MDVNIRRLSGLKYKLVSCFKLAADMDGCDIGEYDADGPAFMKRELVGFVVDRYW